MTMEVESVKNTLTMKYSHNIIEHLGLSLYQNKPTNVIAELVSNSYDADAKNVNIELTNEKIIITDDGLGMTLEELSNKYLVIGKRKRLQKELNQKSPGGRKYMGRKGIGKLAPFGVANHITVITKSKNEGKVNWFSIDLKEILSPEDSSEVNIEKYKPKVIINNEDIDTVHKTLVNKEEMNFWEIFQNNAPVSGTMIILRELTLKQKINAERLKESMGRRFTVTLLEPDFNVYVNGEIVSEEVALPQFEYKFPEDGFDQATIKVNGEEKEVRFWCGFVKKADWPQDQSGVGIYAHGKIAQDRPFTFGIKGLEIFTRYMYAVIEADWVDELPNELISTDRTSINWEDGATQNFHEWGQKQVRTWVKSYREKKKAKQESVIGEKLNNHALPPITSSEKEHIKSIVSSMGDKVNHDGPLQDEVIAKLASAWLHEPAKQMIQNLWNQLKENDENSIQFLKVIENIYEYLIPEALSASSIMAQKIYALSKLHQLSLSGIEEQLQVLLEYFPWIINFEYDKLVANKSLKTLAMEAIDLDYIPAYGETKETLAEWKGSTKTRPDFCFFNTQDQKEFLVVELKNPQIQLNSTNLLQLQSYIAWLKGKFPTAKVRGYLIGVGSKNLENTDTAIAVMDWTELCLHSRRTYLEHLAAMIEGAKDIANPQRIYNLFDLAGDEAKELLHRVSSSNQDFNDFMTRVDREIAAKATKKGK
ncbi:ATP-binding protein [Cardiobacteriaceae bacterium TAE3-ERU3]|nr:ATP-binding protein [Cardiobacteriaceae bacterium TAE3-ERU3]